TNAWVMVNTGLLQGSDQQVVGFVAEQEFDEVVISIGAGVDLGITWVHELIIQPFCEAVVECDTTYYLTTPDFPVYINPVGTGLDGLACVACAVEDAQNVLTPSNTDYAT